MLPTPSRQYVASVKIRRENNRKRKNQINEIVEENEQFRRAMDKHDDEFIELEFKIKDLENTENKRIGRAKYR